MNREAWNGEKAMVAPMPSSIALGNVVWERGRDEPGDSVKRGGIVVGKRIEPETGEFYVKVLQRSMKSGKLDLHTIELDASTLDPMLMQPADRAALHRLIGVLCQYVGNGGGQVWGFRRWALETAGGFLGLADDLEAEQLEAARAEKAAS